MGILYSSEFSRIGQREFVSSGTSSLGRTAGTEMNRVPSGDSIPISLVAHWSFCPRRAWLESVGEVPPPTAQMAAGMAAHKRVDTPTSRDDVDTVRGLNVRNAQLGYHGRIDRAERLGDNSLNLIEHKSTPVKLKPEVSEANRLQLTLQTMALESQGFSVPSAGIYFSNHHGTVFVDIDDVERNAAVHAVEQTRSVVNAVRAPLPLVDDPKCMRCSHAAVCLPEERQEQEVQRRIKVPDPHADVLHLTTPGSRASVRSGRLVVVKGEEKLASIPLERIAAVVVHGNVDLSGALIREMMWRGHPIVWSTGAGRVVGWASGAKPPNGGPRFLQFSAAEQGRVDLAAEFISAKIGNQATILRRFGGPAASVQFLRDQAKLALDASSTGMLFGIEGVAAAEYFREFPALSKASVPSDFLEAFTGRVGRGAVDPFNVALNYGYGMLLGEVVRSVLACGLDPHAGFLHSPGRNKPALALDLMEEFRAPIVDAAVLSAFNNGELNRASFARVMESSRLTLSGRKKLIGAVERRLATEFTHPVFGYKISWRRAIEVQARMVLGVLDGSQKIYKGIRVR